MSLTESSKKKLYLSQWNGARHVAGLPPLRLSQRSGFVSAFYTVSTQHAAIFAPTGACGENQPWAYIEMWKAGNMMIRANIDSRCSKKLLTRVPARSSAARQALLDDNGSSLGFTFVREPLAQFVSGYGESTWRTLTHCCMRNVDNKTAASLKRRAANFKCDVCPHRSELRSRQLANEFLQLVLDADMSRLFTAQQVGVQCMHFFPMANMYQLWQPTSVFHLEALHSDWSTINSSFGLGELQSNLGKHPSSKDPFGRRTALGELLASAPHLQAAIACLLFFDYTCFGYPLPEGASASTCGVADFM